MRAKMVAPAIDRLLCYFDRAQMNPSVPPARINEAIAPLFSMLSRLKPLESNEEAKQLWIRIPRGTIDDYDSYEDLLEWGEVKTRTEYEQRWHSEYPDDYCWYSLVVVETLDRNENVCFRAISLGNNTIVSADMRPNRQPDTLVSDDAAIQLCELIIPAIQESLRMLQEGSYNNLLESSLPYQFRFGVVRRSVMNMYDPEMAAYVRADVHPATLEQFRSYLSDSKNDESKISRINHMTASDFFHACSLGYHACGFNVDGLPEAEQYLKFGDGRDEGLTGRGHGLNAGPGIDCTDPDAWEQWYFHREQRGGHPWEVVAGGNSTHVDLFIYHDRRELEWKLRLGQITPQEMAAHPSGYYFIVAGKHRAAEAIRFYVALKDAGLPVVLRDAAEILARIDATDYIGIVPHHIIPKYCENMFPAEYGHVIDFMHVYDEDIERYGDKIQWLPIPMAELQDTQWL